MICELILPHTHTADASLLAKADQERKAMLRAVQEGGTFGPGGTPEINKLAGAAAGKYCSALFALWPWTASGLVMSADVAYSSGIAQV